MPEEKEINLSEDTKKLNIILENANDVIILVDKWGTILEINKKSMDFGFSPEEIIGKNFLQVGVFSIKDAEKILRLFNNAIKERITNNKGNYPNILELQIKRKNGDPAFVEVNTNPILIDGELEGFISIIRDITQRKIVRKEMERVNKDLEIKVEERTRELKEINLVLEEEISERKKIERDLIRSEDRLKIIFDYAPDSYYLSDLKGNFIDGNRAAEKMIGYKRAELIGKNFLKINLLPINQITRAARLLAKNAMGIPTGPDEFTLNRKDGGQVPVEISTFPIKIQDKKLVLGLARDITGRKQAEKELDKYRKNLEELVEDRTLELEKTNKKLKKEIEERKLAEIKLKEYSRELEDSNRTKALFSDIMHHDLSNPLNIVGLLVEDLLLEETDAEKQEQLEKISMNLDRSFKLMDNAITLSRLESWEDISFKELDLREIIKEVVEHFIPMAEEAGMAIENHINKEMPIIANGILKEIFENLISNSIKYAPEGKRIILTEMEDRDFWTVRVTDFGPGILDEDKKGIFERFQRKDKSGVKGSGLGLAISKKIVDIHGGKIWVEDNHSSGAVFVVELPKNLTR